MAEELESFKIKLRKSEIIFLKEFDAANELSNIIETEFHRIMLKKDDGDIVRVIDNLEKIEKSLTLFIIKHRVILENRLLELLYECVALAQHNRSIERMSITEDQKTAAQELLNKLLTAKKYMENQVRKQIAF